VVVLGLNHQKGKIQGECQTVGVNLCNTWNFSWNKGIGGMALDHNNRNTEDGISEFQRQEFTKNLLIVDLKQNRNYGRVIKVLFYGFIFELKNKIKNCKEETGDQMTHSSLPSIDDTFIQVLTLKEGEKVEEKKEATASIKNKVESIQNLITF